VSRVASAGLLAAAAVAIALVAIDVVRQLQLGQADVGLALFAPATGFGVAVGVVVGSWPGRVRMGALIVAWALVSVVTEFGVDWPTSRLATTLWMLATGVLPATYAWMVLAYPSGRLHGRLERGLVVVAFALGLAWMGVPLLFADLRRCAACTPRANSLLYTGLSFDYFTLAGRVFWSSFIVLGGCFVWLLIRRLRQAPRGARVTLLPLAVAVVFAVANFVAVRVVWLGGWRSPIATLNWVDWLSALVLPAAILIGIASIRRRRGPLGDLVVELGSVPAGQVRTALAHTLGDPSLELGLWLPDRAAFVDEAGQPIDPTPAAGRAVTVIGPSEEPLAALVHDERLQGQRPLLEAAGSAAAIALENTRLQAQLRAQLAELTASRTRIVTSADEERRRLERDLHDGAQQHLLAVGLALQLLHENRGDPELLHQAEEELQTALRELRDLARGIHPAILSERGLAAAVGSLADRAPIKVLTDVQDERYPPPVETAAYFVVSEALANVAKHANAHSATVSIDRQDGRLVIEVRDDGRGGADPTVGSGLRGLSDRVGAVGGRLDLRSQAGQGTTVHAEIPCASS
jgi:signal transduction histidine kinase